MINFYFVDFAKVVLALILALFQSSPKTASAHAAMLNAGDTIDGMALTKGAGDARPLWVFCSSEVIGHVTTADCRVPQKAAKLAIGHVFLATDNAFRKANWSELIWQLYIDDQMINLNDFGTYDYLLPTMAPNPSLVREVFMKFTAWDVVLTNLQPGKHIIEGQVRSDAEEYRWVVNLVIEDKSAPVENLSNRQDSTDSQSRCSQNLNRLSKFHHACRLYG
jgi:hypothetical protein